MFGLINGNQGNLRLLMYITFNLNKMKPEITLYYIMLHFKNIFQK